MEKRKQIMMKFAHLHCHTEGSLLDGIIKPLKLLEKCIERNIAAVAITDHGNMNSHLQAQLEGGQLEQCPKIIFGSEMYFVDDKRHRIGGPALTSPDGTQMYFEDNKCHRMGGPAVIRPGGAKEYFIYGKRVTELEHNLLCDIMKLKDLI